MTYISWSSDLFVSLNPVKLEVIMLWIRVLVQSDTVSNLILFVGHCDLYSMVQGFCLISLALSNR